MEINKIIKEEIQSMNERQPIFRFTQRIENPSFFNFHPFSNDYDVDISESDIVVIWRVGFWLRDDGIENFGVDVQEVQGSYKVELYDKRTDELAQEIEKNIAEVKWKFQILEASLIKSGSLYIDNISFDFQTQLCNVELA